MKTSLLSSITRALVLGALISAGALAQDPAPKLDLPAPSPTATLKQRVGVTDIEVVYSRPSMKGREIFGKLEPYGAVWRTGANNATRITFSTDVKIQGSALAAGTYELFTIPGRDEWTVIFQKAGTQWGAYAYKQENDTLRVTAKPFDFPLPVETFTIDFNELRDSSATMNLIWERTLVSLKIEVDVTSLVPQIEAVMAGPGTKKPYVAAAMFYLDNHLDLRKALAWMDAAIAEQPEAFYFVYRKAKVQAALGDKAGAIATARASLAGAAKAPSPLLRDEYTRLNNELIASLK
jgi:hypothetical protein